MQLQKILLPDKCAGAQKASPSPIPSAFEQQPRIAQLRTAATANIRLQRNINGFAVMIRRFRRQARKPQRRKLSQRRFASFPGGDRERLLLLAQILEHAHPGAHVSSVASGVAAAVERGTTAATATATVATAASRIGDAAYYGSSRWLLLVNVDVVPLCHGLKYGLRCAINLSR